MNKNKRFKNIPNHRGHRVIFICIALCIHLTFLGFRFSLNAEEEILDNTGAAFLTIDPFPRTSAMGSAFTGASNGINSLYFNPAGLVLRGRDIISSTHCEWFQGMRFENVAVSHDMKSKGALGVNVKGFYTGGLEKRTGDTQEPEGTFGAYFIDFGVTYSKQLFYFLPFGFSLKGIYERIDKETAFGTALDIGLVYLTAVNGLQFGLALKNLGSDMQFKKEKFKMPVMMRLGAGYKTLGGNLLLSGDFEKIGKRKATLSLGCEVIILKTLSLRTGVNGENRKDIGSKDAGLSVGAGFVVGNLSIDYAFVNYSYLGMTHRFGITFTPGVTEEERKRIQKLALEEARKSMLEKEKMMSSMYLEKGKGLIAEGKYDKAIDALDISLVWEPGNLKAKQQIKNAKEKKKEKEESNAFMLGRDAFSSGNFLEAIRQFNRVLELNSKNADAKELRNQARSKLEEQSKKLALRKREGSEDIQSLFNEAVKEYTKSHYKLAITKWQKVLAIDPKREDAKSYIEKAQRKLNKKVLSLEKKLNDLVNKKDWFGVVSTAKEIKSVKPSNKKAITAEKKAIDEINKLIQSNLKKAKEYYEKGNMFASEEYFRVVLRYDPKNKEAKSYLTKIEKGGKKEDADKWYLKGIDAYTKNQFKLAISYWNRCLSIDPSYEKAKKNITRARKKLVELGKSE